MTQKGQIVSRLHAKTNQIGKILSNLEKFNTMMKGDGDKTPTSPNTVLNQLMKTPTSPKDPTQSFFAAAAAARDEKFAPTRGRSQTDQSQSNVQPVPRKRMTTDNKSND